MQYLQQTIDILWLMRRRQGNTQTRTARRYRWRADRTHPQALRTQVLRQIKRSLIIPHQQRLNGG
ncbi:hypothetical protein D3C78_1558030 [compost metagenome]